MRTSGVGQWQSEVGVLGPREVSLWPGHPAEKLQGLDPTLGTHWVLAMAQAPSSLSEQSGKSSLALESEETAETISFIHIAPCCHQLI